MRSKASEIVSSFDCYNRVGDYRDEDTFEIATDFIVPNGKTLVEDDGIVKFFSEMLDYKGILELSKKGLNKLDSSNVYVLSFDKFISEGSNFQKYPPRLSDADYDSRPRGWREDSEDEEEE